MNLIATTTTRTGLKVRAALNQHTCPPGLKVKDAEMEALHLVRDAFHGEWNYSLLSRARLPIG